MIFTAHHSVLYVYVVVGYSEYQKYKSRRLDNVLLMQL